MAGTSSRWAASTSRWPTGSPTSPSCSASGPGCGSGGAAADQWRVDKLLATGEVDLVHDGRRHHPVELRARPRQRPASTRRSGCRATADLLPPAGHGAAADATPTRTTCTRLPDRRVAGRDALGLRLVPAPAVEHRPRRRLGRPGTGSRCAVEVYGDASAAGLQQRVPRRSTLSRPAARGRRFRAAPGPTRLDDVLDIADAANQYAPVVPPDTLAGLPRSGDTTGGRRHLRGGRDATARDPAAGQDAEPLRQQLAARSATGRSTRTSWSRSGRWGSMVTGECRATTAGW